MKITMEVRTSEKVAGVEYEGSIRVTIPGQQESRSFSFHTRHPSDADRVELEIGKKGTDLVAVRGKLTEERAKSLSSLQRTALALFTQPIAEGVVEIQSRHSLEMEKISGLAAILGGSSSVRTERSYTADLQGKMLEEVLALLE